MSLTLITLIALTSSACAGFLLGNIKIKGISVGVGGILFAGLFIGCLADIKGIAFNAEVMNFIREFGLVLFVYSMGLEVGPNVIQSFRKDGLKMNLVAFLSVSVSIILALIVFKISGVSLPVLMGLFSGAVTNTPSLASSQQILGELGFLTDEISQTAVMYALAYPFAILSGMSALLMIRIIARVKIVDEVTAYEFQKAQDNPQMEAFNVVVKSPELNNVSVGIFSKMVNDAVVVSRMKRGNEFIVPNDETKLQIGDMLLLFGPKKYFATVSLLFQEETEHDLVKESAEQIQSQSIFVTRLSRVGLPLKKIMGDKRHQWVISRVIRHDISLPAKPDLRLAYGDEVIAVGRPLHLMTLMRFLGNRSSSLKIMRFVPFFLGMTLGVLIGMIPLYLPGIATPLRLGSAGGPLLVALLLSQRGSVGKMIFYMPKQSVSTLKDLGIIVFLAVVGLSAGTGLLNVLAQGQAMTLIGYGILLTMLPLLIVGLFARFVLKMNYLLLCGALSGSVTSLASLVFINSMAGTDTPILGYASVFPLTSCLRIIGAQIIVVMLF